MLQTFSVWTFTPSVAPTTTTAPSTTRRALRASVRNAAKPGVSTRFSLCPFHSAQATAVLMLIFRRISSSSKSVVVVPSSTRPSRVVAPAQNSRASVSVVLPAAPWATRAMLRIFAVSGRFMVSLAIPDGVSCVYGQAGPTSRTDPTGLGFLTHPPRPVQEKTPRPVAAGRPGGPWMVAAQPATAGRTDPPSGITATNGSGPTARSAAASAVCVSPKGTKPSERANSAGIDDTR